MPPSCLTRHPEIPSLSTFDALQRIFTLTEKLYPQCITWNRNTWRASKTVPDSRLIPWYLLSLLVAVQGSYFLCIICHEIIAFHKDPDITLASGAVLLLSASAEILTTSVVSTFIWKSNELCFVWDNVKRINPPVLISNGT